MVKIHGEIHHFFSVTSPCPKPPGISNFELNSVHPIQQKSLQRYEYFMSQELLPKVGCEFEEYPGIFKMIPTLVPLA